MSSKAAAWVKAGLYLLFIVALAVLTPVQAQAGIGPLRAKAAEMQTESKEHRDSEKLRERLHGSTPQRRLAEDRAKRFKPLPAAMQPAPVRLAVERPAADSVCRPRESIDECVRARFSPSSLQVFRR